MIHKMPRIGGFELLNDRVFHVLVVTAHSTYHDEVDQSMTQSEERRQSYTVQLPIDFQTFNKVDTIMRRSHVRTKGSSLRYHLPSEPVNPNQPGSAILETGKKLIEGNYFSLERLREAPRTGPADQRSPILPVEVTNTDYCHRWDMMTLSTAGGITRFAPKRVQVKETLDAIAKDVHYVIKYIADQRLSVAMQNQTLSG